MISVIDPAGVLPELPGFWAVTVIETEVVPDASVADSVVVNWTPPRSSERNSGSQRNVGCCRGRQTEGNRSGSRSRWFRPYPKETERRQNRIGLRLHGS